MKDLTEKAKLTNGIPECPFCKKPTQRTGGQGSETLMYFAPMYGENGLNINPDRNIKTTYWRCFECDKEYSITGNNVDGFSY